MHRRYHILPFISALLLATAFWRYELGFLVLAALVPLLFYLYIASKSRGSFMPILMTWVAGMIYMGSVVAWMLQVRAEDWAGVSPVAGSILVFVCWVICCILFSVGFIFFAWIALKIFRSKAKLNWFWVLFAIPAAWISMEYFRSWLFSIVWYAPEGTLGPHWNFGNLGLGATSTPLADSSSYLGMFGLSFIVVVINIALLWVLQKKYLQGLACLLGITLILGAGFLPNKASKNVDVGLVQLPAGADQFQDELTQLVPEPESKVQFLVLPEYSNFLETGGINNSKLLISNLVQQNRGFGVYSRPKPQRDLVNLRKDIDEIVYFNEDAEVLATQDKKFLIPTGEYMPSILRGVLTLFHQQKALRNFDRARGLQPGETPENVFRHGGLAVGTYACSGIIAPSSYRKFAKEGAEILASNSSLGIFGNSKQFFGQLKTMTRFNASANQRPFVQATQGGYSYIVNYDGRFLVATDNQDLSYHQASVTVPKHRTFYTIIGEFSVGVSFALVAGFLFSKRMQGKKKHR